MTAVNAPTATMATKNQLPRLLCREVNAIPERVVRRSPDGPMGSVRLVLELDTVGYFRARAQVEGLVCPASHGDTLDERRFRRDTQPNYLRTIPIARDA